MMQSLFYVLLALPLASSHPQHQQVVKVTVPGQAFSTAGIPLDNFLSYSIEFSYFPDYAGNATHPNTFSNNILENIAKYSGSRPFVRVGGSSQDNAYFVASQKEASILRFATPNADQPANLTFGPAFFESYHTWSETKFIHGFNLKANSTADRQAVIDSAKVACRSLGGQALAWQLGNEADAYTFAAIGATRPPSYNEASYVEEWLNVTRAIRSSVESACPELASTEWYAPSFATSPGFSQLDQIKAWDAGLDTDHNLKVFDQHQ